jgi:hypothetical protein
MDKNVVLEISQVANGFIVRRSPGNWMSHDETRQMWLGTTSDYYVFQSLHAMQCFLAVHFSHRDTSHGDFEQIPT